MANSLKQSRDILHPLAFNFVDKCNKIGVQLNPDEINAIDFLTRQLVTNNLWDKFKAIYPFVGGSSKSHSLNLKNTERHNIVWYNENDLTHNKFGVTNRGAGYGNTMVAPSWFSDDDIHISVYNATIWPELNQTAPVIGSRPSDDTRRGWMHSIYLKSIEAETRDSIFGGTYPGWVTPPIFTYSCGYASNSSIRFAGSDAAQFQHLETLGYIVGINGIKCYINGDIYGRQGSLSDNPTEPINQVSTRTVDGATAEIPNISQFPFLLFTNGRFTSTSGRARANIRFASIGYAFSDSENKILYNIVQNFQKILGRSVAPIQLKFIERSLKNSKIIANVEINKIINIKTKPYREFLNIIRQPGEFSKINRITSNVTISKLEVFGPVRIFLGDQASASVSILSLVET